MVADTTQELAADAGRRRVSAGPAVAWMLVALLVLSALVLGGTLLYHTYEGQSWADSLWMTIITISTVGYREPWELSGAGRIITAAILVFGVGAVAVLLTALFEVLMHRQLRDIMGKRAMFKQIKAQKGHVIVCGYGRMGRIIAQELTESHRGMVVVDRSVAIATEIGDETMLVTGDACDESVLERAGIANAGALVATLRGDADNVFLTLTARQMRPDLPIIVRAEEEASISKFRQAGATRVVCPYQIGANHVVRLLTRPHIIDFIELADRPGAPTFAVQEVAVDAEHPFAGKSLAEARVRQEAGIIVLAIRHADGTSEFDPSPSSLIVEGDTLIGVARPSEE